MSIIRRALQPPERRGLGDWLFNPAIPSNSEAATHHLGGAMTPNRALTHKAVWSCVRLIADDIAALPIDTFERRPGERAVQIANPPVVERPWPEVDAGEWVFAWLVSVLIDGNVFCNITGLDRDARPDSLQLLSPDSVTVHRTRSGLAYRVGTTDMPSGLIVHSRGFTWPGSDRGLSPIRFHAASIEPGLAARRYGLRWFDDGGHPSSVLSSDQAVDQTTAEEVKRRYRRAVADGGPVVLGAGLQWSQVQVSPEESQFLETIEASDSDVAQIFGVFPEMIGASSGGNSITYANVEQRQLAHQQHTLLPWARRLERMWTRLLNIARTPSEPERFVRFNFDAAVRVDLRNRYEAHGMAIRDGWASPDERRELEDLPPIPDGQGDKFLWPPRATGKAGEDKETDQ